MAGKTIVILGGGVGGQVAASALRRRLDRRHRVVLIDRTARQPFIASYLWVMVGWRRASQLFNDLRKRRPAGIEFLEAEVDHIDAQRKVVKAADQDVAYDYLVLAPGASTVPEALPGFPDAAHNLYDLDGVARLYQALSGFSAGTVAVLVSAVPFKCPAAPYEAALLLDDFFARRGVRNKVDIQVFTPEPHPMPVAGPAMGQAVQDMLGQRNIAYHPNLKATAIDPSSRQLIFEGDEKATFDLLVGVPPHRCPAVVKDSGLTDDSGWVPVDAGTLRAGGDNVFTIGDAAAVRLPGRYKPEVPLMLPKAGVFAHAQAQVLAENIAAEIAGRQPPARFDGKGYCWLEMGRGLAAFASGDFFAEPAPTVELRTPGRLWHLGKVLFERYWLAQGPARPPLRALLALGARAARVPAKV